MTLRTYAEFTSDLPTEQIESETDFVQLGGRPVAAALSSIFAGLGCQVRAVESAAHRGWDFRFRCGKLRLWCQVSLIEGYLVIIQDLSARWRIFGGDHRDFVELMSRFGDALAADPRFHDVGWFHEDEILSERAGANRPSGAFSDIPCVRLQTVDDAPPAGA
ncbi:hypothetical protein LJR225_003680 [Phenylobacterium sp. LjRoot225]|uniref:hypothetical protein n=1 Tax=Phenylobacterium sp. LjRoot225 TaxID=3342285 RepID=UPI003ECDC3DA